MSSIEAFGSYVRACDEPVVLSYSGIKFNVTVSDTALTVKPNVDGAQHSEFNIVLHAPLMKLVGFLSEATVFLDPGPTIRKTPKLYILNDIQKLMNQPEKETPCL